MKKLLAVAALTLTPYMLLCVYAWSESARETAAFKARWADEEARPKLTMRDYDQLELGMPAHRVGAILLPAVGQELSRAGHLEIRVYDDGPRRVVVTFEGGQLVAKAQRGL